MSDPGGWAAALAARLDAVEQTGRRRHIRSLDGPGPHFLLDDGRQVVSFASNDYLGLSQHPKVTAAAIDAVRRWGAGSGSARLIVGDRPPHRALEAALADWKGTDAALVLPTGFSANLAVMSTLATPETLVLSDELNHASIIDGCRLSKATVAVYRHGDTEHAARLAAAHRGPVLVVTDTVFSMDGDLAPVPELIELCLERDALLVLDEAHAVLGPDLGTVPAELNLVRVGTQSKTLGSLGGFVAASRSVIDLLISTARPFIFTTAPTPADTAAALAALEVARSEEGEALLTRLRAHVERVAPGHPSPIVAIVLGEEARAMEAAEHLLETHGLLVPAIRPPTVAPGTCRLRVALSAAHTETDVDRLAKALAEL